jgi:catechol 2,3-dioxygenase-like lactoylglutathione lyase family enzyme
MRIGGLEHVLVLSDDIDATRDFYCSVLGLSVGDRPPLAFRGYWLYAPGAPGSCVHVAERSAYAAHAAGLGLVVPSQGVGGGPVDHVAFSAEDWDAVTAQLERCGVAYVLNTVPGGPRQAFVEDPNGVRVEINVLDRDPNEVSHG